MPLPLFLILAVLQFPPGAGQPTAALRADAFRIDLSRVDVTLDLHPRAGTLEGRALLRFRMRPGQSRPLFHFAPSVREGTARDALTAVLLDGEPVEHRGDGLREIRFPGSSQMGFEVRSECASKVEHTIEVRWVLHDLHELRTTGLFQSEVDDTVGRGNERLWPTINAPGELARHRICLRIHDRREYTVVASGRTTRVTRRVTAKDPLQVFVIDSEREVASYTVMLAALPATEARIERFEVEGVPVRIVSRQPASDVVTARSTIERTLPALIRDFGPYPAPSLQVFLVDWDDGMEYFGGTITGIDSLEHELVHLYWGTSAVGRTWRDTWLDEAIAVWWTEPDDLDPLPKRFASNMVSGRSPIEPGFDLRAYDEGASVMTEIAEALGGRRAMMRFLAGVHSRRAFVPFSTREFVGDVMAAVDCEKRGCLRERIERWLFSPPSVAPGEVFDALWHAFRKRYAFFDVRGVDWDRQYRELRPRIRPQMSDSELFLLLCDLLRPLGDAHVTLEREGAPTFSAERPSRLAREFDDSQLDALSAVTRATLRAEGFGPLRRRARGLRFAISEHLGYLKLRSFSGPRKPIVRGLDRVLEKLSDRCGLIVDVRGNPGGQDAVAYAVACRFADKVRVGHIKRTRLGPGPNDFGPPKVWRLKPRGAWRFTRPIALLTDSETFSAAEVFALAMRALPHVTIVGERTHGVFSDMFEGELPNGWTYTLSHQRYFSPEGVCYEGQGVPVGLTVLNTTEDLETRRDPVLRAAIQLLATPPGADGAKPSGSTKH